MPDDKKSREHREAIPKRTHTEKPEIIAHTSLRGFGAIGVMVYHFLFFYDAEGSRIDLTNIVNNYGLILELFFINSGFIISYIYADSFSSKISSKYTFRFLWARFARLYPVHFLMLAMYFVAHTAKYLLPEMSTTGSLPSFFAPPETIYNLVASVLMIHAWGVTDAISWNMVSWAVSAEFAAYLLFPPLSLLIGRIPQVGSLLVLGGALTLYWYIGRTFGDLDAPGNYGAIRCIAGFALGMVLYRCLPLIQSLPTKAVSLLQAAALIAVLAMYLYATVQLLVVASVALLIVSTSVNRGWLSNALKWSPLRFLGQISFTLYMTHVVAGMMARPVIYYLGQAYVDIQSDTWAVIVLAIKSLFALPFAYLLFKYFELPARDWLVSLERKRRNAAVVTH